MTKQRARVVTGGVAVELEQSLTILDTNDALVLTEIPSEYLVAELVRRKVLGGTNLALGHYQHVACAVRELASKGHVLRTIEEDALDYARVETQTIADAARMLGISRPTYYDKVKYRHMRNKALPASKEK